MNFLRKLEIPGRLRRLIEYLVSPTPKRKEGFRVKAIIRRKRISRKGRQAEQQRRIRRRLDKSKRRIQRRLDKTDLRGNSQPLMTARNIHYELGKRTRGLNVGGIGL